MSDDQLVDQLVGVHQKSNDELVTRNVGAIEIQCNSMELESSWRRKVICVTCSEGASECVGVLGETRKWKRLQMGIYYLYFGQDENIVTA